MRKLLACAVLVGSSALALFAYAQSAGCVQDGFSVLCAPPGGAIVKDGPRYVCGPGQCVSDGVRNICSAQPGGSAFSDGVAVRCVGGCVTASSSYCVKPH